MTDALSSLMRCGIAAGVMMDFMQGVQGGARGTLDVHALLQRLKHAKQTAGKVWLRSVLRGVQAHPGETRAAAVGSALPGATPCSAADASTQTSPLAAAGGSGCGGTASSSAEASLSTAHCAAVPCAQCDELHRHIRKQDQACRVLQKELLRRLQKR